MKDLTVDCWEVDRKLLFEIVKNNIIVHQHRINCNFDLMMSTNTGNWVKTRSTWYLHFLMIQYDNQRGVEHFKVTRNVIVQITKKLKPLIQRKDTRSKQPF
jgi:hypothetical protein